MAQRGGIIDKASFVRLAGAGMTLRLPESPDGRRNAIGQVAVMACQITKSGWVGGDGMSMAEAPPWDPATCTAGVPSGTGSWAFDLAAFEDPVDDRGLALVPQTETIDFQVTLVRPD